MKTEQIKELLGEQMNQASQVDVTLNTNGWKIFEKMVDEKVADMNDIDGIKTLKELQANQIAKKKIIKIIEEFKGIRASGIKAKIDLDNLETTK